ncbi:hypothetical protein [Mycobacterium sp. DL440]|uniref:hypothetical protein n=1 Tax=Mycobacterium sp. DL440 TaxID=2675523 RepID=UPI00141EE194|nr:hypothetical protein [Mycobacterium sp. DL440]
MVSQIFVVCLAAYLWLVDERSPVDQLGGVTGTALMFNGAVNRGAVAVVALFPLLGLVQFWLQSDYLPARSLPLVDVQAELTPVGSSGSIIHLSAKLTMHNRSSVAVDIPGGVMRVAAYPFGIPEEPATAERVASTRTCYEPKKSYNADISGYLNEADVLHDWPGGKALCTGLSSVLKAQSRTWSQTTRY